jgi:hypothetical protein
MVVGSLDLGFNLNAIFMQLERYYCGKEPDFVVHSFWGFEFSGNFNMYRYEHRIYGFLFI